MYILISCNFEELQYAPTLGTCALRTQLDIRTMFGELQYAPTLGTCALRTQLDVRTMFSRIGESGRKETPDQLSSPTLTTTQPIDKIMHACNAVSNEDGKINVTNCSNYVSD